MTAFLLKLLAGAGLAAAVAASALVLPKYLRQPSQKSSVAIQLQITGNVSVKSSGAVKAPAAKSAAFFDPANTLELRILTADTGQPIPDVRIDYTLTTKDGDDHDKSLTSSPQGICEVPAPRASLAALVLVSQRDGFADTRLQWHADRGETIPSQYTLRLPRGVQIGGTVVDTDGNPVAGVKVGFDNDADPAADDATESSNFGPQFWVTTTTDARGQWTASRIARETLRTVSGSASHPLHVRSEFDSGNQDVIRQLLAGTYVFRMGRGVEAAGSVVDTNGCPVSGGQNYRWHC